MRPNLIARKAWFKRGLLIWPLCFFSACGTESQVATRTEVSLPAVHAGDERHPAARPSAVTEQRMPTPAEQAVINSLMGQAEVLRALYFRAPVPVVIENEGAIIAHVEHELRTAAFERAKLIYRALGMISPKLDVAAVLTATLAEQIVGYYDAQQQRLVVRDEVFAGLLRGNSDEGARAAREVLLHELVHALQDQHLGLRTDVDDDESSDALNAYRALVEGDATLTTAALTAQASGKDLRSLASDPARLRGLTASIRKAAMASPLLSHAPTILRDPLLFAYCDGLRFAAGLWTEHGSFAGIDAAHRKPPRTTEQILHPKRVPAGAAPLRVGPNSALIAAHYELMTEDTLGELELGIYLGQANPGDAARSAADGWDGDRVQIYRHRSGALAALWLTRWDRPREAREMARAAQRVLSAIDGQALAGRVGLRVQDRHVVLVHGVPGELVNPSLDAALIGQLDRPAAAN